MQLILDKLSGNCRRRKYTSRKYLENVLFKLRVCSQIRKINFTHAQRAEFSQPVTLIQFPLLFLIGSKSVYNKLLLSRELRLKEGAALGRSFLASLARASYYIYFTIIWKTYDY